jgi:hypothetical protein
MVADVRAPHRLRFRNVARVLLAAACFLLCSVAWAGGAAVDAATPAEQAKAQELYAQGVQHFKAGRHDEAAKAFRNSFELVASPNSQIMHARALREAGRLAEAYEQFALTQKEASELAVRLPKYGTTAESAEAELLELRKRVAVLSVEVVGEMEGIVVSIGSRRIARERWREIAVEPGRVDVTARLPDGRRASQSVDAHPGEVTSVRLDASAQTASQARQGDAPVSDHASDRQFDAGAKPSSSLRPWAYLAGGLGVAGIATFAVFGSMSRSTFAELEAGCPNDVCPPQRQAEIDQGKREQMIANLGLAVGVVGLGAGVTLILIDGGEREASSGPRLRAVAGPGSISLRGRF